MPSASAPPKDKIARPQEFQGATFSQREIARGNYENCIFAGCILPKSDLSGSRFVDCEFRNCDLSLSKVNHTAFRNIRFRGSKLVGLHFENCNPLGFSASFEGCQLNLSSFFRLNLKQTVFKECDLREVDFTESNLTEVLFGNCDLSGAIFSRTILERTDFRTAVNYSLDPELNRIKKARFSLMGVPGLLDKYNIEIE